jgi:hypothetical protein
MLRAILDRETAVSRYEMGIPGLKGQNGLEFPT